MTLYFGIPGSLITLTSPKGGVTATREVPRQVFQLDSGGVRVGQVVSGRRKFTLSYAGLGVDDFRTLQAFEHGHWGPGPFALYDSSWHNLLNVRQSSATSSTGDASGFTATSGTGTLSSTPNVFNRGPRSLDWFWGGAASGSQVMRLDPVVSTWYGVPVVVGLPYTFSCYVKGFGSDPVVQLTADIVWKNAAGTVITTTSSSPMNSSSFSYQPFIVTDTAPAGAAYAYVGLTATGSTITSDSTLSLDNFQFEQASDITTWSPGTGLYPVVFLSATQDVYRWQLDQYRDAPAVTLQEVG